MENKTSCVGCKFLYTQGHGYSNYTWEETTVGCAKDSNPNPNLPMDEPFDWDEVADNWPATLSSRCAHYSQGAKVCLDVDGEDHPDDYTSDEEAIQAICAHSGRERSRKATCG